MEIDAIFPLLCIPNKLLKKKKKNNENPDENDRKIMSLLEKNIKEPDNIKDFVYICRLLEKLSDESKNALSISVFF